MKRFFIILLAFFAVLCGCSQNGGRPETVARKFCEAMYDNDMARAKTYMVPEYAKTAPDVIQERWLACSMEMEKVDGCWKVTTYGY